VLKNYLWLKGQQKGQQFLAVHFWLHDDRRPPAERTASGRYLQPGNKGEPPMSAALRPLCLAGSASILNQEAAMLFASRRRAKATAVVLTLAATPALAENPAPAPQASADAGTTSIPLDTIEIISQELNAARLQIQPSLGASTYTFSPEAIETIPQGENAPLNQVLLQMPGVAQDSFGQIHVRGEHANVQFRINGVQLPEGLSVFGQALETRLANSISLLTGALPAQYGFQTAGVLGIQTKTGLTNPGFLLSMYGGSFNWLQPSFEYGGHEGPVDWFLTGDYLGNDRGIENPAATFNAIHDKTQQFHGFSYMSGIIDPDTRVSVVGGAFDGRFQIPNNPGQVPSLGLKVFGTTAFNSNLLNEVQHEATQFGLISLQKHVGDINLQLSAFVRNSVLSFSPDVTGDLLFNGITPFARRSDLAEGVQADASCRINDSHNLRGGFLGQVETTAFDTTSFVLPVDKHDGKPRPPKTVAPFDDRDIARLPALPVGWSWVRLGELFSSSPKNGLYKPATEYGAGTTIIRIDDFYDGRLIRKSGFKC
jgi:hypothetical protein